MFFEVIQNRGQRFMSDNWPGPEPQLFSDLFIFSLLNLNSCVKRTHKTLCVSWFLSVTHVVDGGVRHRKAVEYIHTIYNLSSCR